MGYIMTPAERLLAAADLLDKRAGEATAGPWAFWAGAEQSLVCTTVDHCTCGGGLEGYGHEPGCGLEQPPGIQASHEDAHYIAIMHPEVGQELADWLRCAGGLLAAKPTVYQELVDLRRAEFDGMLGYALTLAERLLAGEPQ